MITSCRSIQYDGAYSWPCSKVSYKDPIKTLDRIPRCLNLAEFFFGDKSNPKNFWHTPGKTIKDKFNKINKRGLLKYSYFLTAMDPFKMKLNEESKTHKKADLPVLNYLTIDWLLMNSKKRIHVLNWPKYNKGIYEAFDLTMFSDEIRQQGHLIKFDSSVMAGGLDSVFMCRGSKMSDEKLAKFGSLNNIQLNRGKYAGGYYQINGNEFKQSIANIGSTIQSSLLLFQISNGKPIRRLKIQLDEFSGYSIAMAATIVGLNIRPNVSLLQYHKGKYTEIPVV